MRTASLLLALGVTQLGLAAPVPQSWEDLVLPEGLSSRSVPVTRVSRRSTKTDETPDLDSTRSSLNSGIAFDNRPLTPSGTVPASEALTATRPLHTAFLQALSKGKDAVMVIVDVEDDGTPVVSAVPVAVAHHFPAYEAITEVDAATMRPVEVVKVIEVASGGAKTKKVWATQAKTGPAPSRSTTGEMLKGLYADYTPCWKKTTARVHRLARGKSDLIVVGAFLALTVMLWTLQVMSGVILRSCSDWLGSRQGTIRLEGGERDPCPEDYELEKTTETVTPATNTYHETLAPHLRQSSQETAPPNPL
ncbi:hypothetical protein HYQ46_008739 [Verticillium longisporum]|nr:hypothetical protein HYQ46_008739 [Verticillium longisporum]